MRSIGMTNFEFLILIEFLNGLIFKLSHWNLIRNWKLKIGNSAAAQRLCCAY